MHLKRENVSWALSPHFIVIVYTLPECVLMISIDGRRLTYSLESIECRSQIKFLIKN